MLDRQKLTETVETCYNTDARNLTVFSRKDPEYYLYVENDTLWVQTSIEFRYEGKADPEGYKPEMVGSFTYMIKVAEIATESSGTQTPTSPVVTG